MQDFSFTVVTLEMGRQQQIQCGAEVCILYLAEGNAAFQGSESGILSPNEYYIVPPWEQVMLRAVEASALWILRMSRGMLETVQAPGDGLWDAFLDLPRRHMDARNPNNMIIRELLQNLVYNQNQPYLSASYIRMHAGIIAVVVARTCRLQPRGETRVTQMPLSMTDIYSYVREHLQGDLSVAAIAKALHFSPSYLAHAFRKNAGISIHQYVLSRRLEAANTLLLQGVPVLEAGQRCGFQTSEAFIRAYRRRFGMTPGQLQRQERKKGNSHEN